MRVGIGMLSLFAGVVLALGLGARTSAHADSDIVTKDFDYTTTVPNCDLEEVTINGHLIVTLQDVTDGAGQEHIHLTMHTHGTGTDTGGTHYVLNCTEVDILNPDASRISGPFENSTVVPCNLISQGSSPNLLSHITFHLTINANGEVTANVANVSIECQ